jgi:hypothetical protein
LLMKVDTPIKDLIDKYTNSLSELLLEKFLMKKAIQKLN